MTIPDPLSAGLMMIESSWIRLRRALSSSLDRLLLPRSFVSRITLEVTSSRYMSSHGSLPFGGAH